MAFASIGDLGTASTKTAGSTLSMSPSSTVAVGRLLVVWSGYFATGKPTVQIRNVTQAVDMLTTKCEIDASELNSKDAATQPVIDTANDDVAWGDHLAIDVDVAGTGAKGLGVILTFRAP